MIRYTDVKEGVRVLSHYGDSGGVPGTLTGQTKEGKIEVMWDFGRLDPIFLYPTEMDLIGQRTEDGPDVIKENLGRTAEAVIGLLHGGRKKGETENSP